MTEKNTIEEGLSNIPNKDNKYSITKQEYQTTIEAVKLSEDEKQILAQLIR